LSGSSALQLAIGKHASLEAVVAFSEDMVRFVGVVGVMLDGVVGVMFDGVVEVMLDGVVCVSEQLSESPLNEQLQSSSYSGLLETREITKPKTIP
jgi:hypothetical protein